MRASAAHRAWLVNIDRHDVAAQVVADLVRRWNITRDSFRVLDATARITDPDDNSYFVIPRGAGAGVARRAALLTYLLNAGTGYRRAGTRGDFPVTAYGAAETQRIIERQWANRWSYRAVRRVCDTGGCLVTTPNGMLMGLGGSRIHAQFSRRGGTTWGDLFIARNDQVADPAERLQDIVESGRVHLGGPSLDRLLHHEEIHAQQWASLGPLQFPARYLAAETTARIFGRINRFEQQAGLSDGGYR